MRPPAAPGQTGMSAARADKHGLTIDHERLRTVVFKIRREHDNLVAGVRQGKERIDHRLGRADGDDHIRFRVERAPHKAPAFARERPPEVGRAHGDGVLVRTDGAQLRQTVGHGFGRGKIGKALREVDRAARQADAGHPADHGIGKMLAAAAHLLHTDRPFWN